MKTVFFRARSTVWVFYYKLLQGTYWEIAKTLSFYNVCCRLSKMLKTVRNTDHYRQRKKDAILHDEKARVFPEVVKS
jgi:hypothetical protein